MIKKHRVAVILSGCGYEDGTEINEAVFVLLACSQADLEIEAFAPNILQRKVVDHNATSGQKFSVDNTTQNRSVMEESARITRGNVRELSELNEEDFSAIIIPGGRGLIDNLSDIEEKGKEDCVINPILTKIIQSFFRNEKPIGAICIAPFIVALILKHHVNKDMLLTIGHNDDQGIFLGLPVSHQSCKSDQIIIDRHNMIVSTPAFMSVKSKKDLQHLYHHIYRGIKLLIDEIVILIN